VSILTLGRILFLSALWLFVVVAVVMARKNLLSSTEAGRQQRRARRITPAPLQRPPHAVFRAPPRVRLLVTSGHLAGTSIGLGDQQVSIGMADDATLVLNDDDVSGRHARLFPQEGQWIVEDLGSTSGTYLNRRRVIEPTPVPLGVPIRIGRTVLELRR
jgi:hypothetical protein